MTSKFKNIIFFSTNGENSSLFKTRLEGINSIKIFKTTDVDEVQQIIDQSEKAVLLVDNEVSAVKLFKATLNKKTAHFKMYYLNWDLVMEKEVRENIIEKNFTIVNSEDVDAAYERVELYFFGRVNVLNNPDVASSDKKSQFKKGYFTHLERLENKWRILTSSHEADDEINQVLGKNWDTYLETLLEDGAHLKEMFERKLDSALYHELVYPHLENGKVKKLSIVHVKLDNHFVENIMVIHKFLKELK